MTISVPLNRIYYYHLVTTFFPTTCLLIISCLTLCIGHEHFEATVALSLTAMLVMQTLHENISNDLPKTSYVKLVDWWLMFGIVVPFLVFLVVVAVEMLPKEESATELVSCGCRQQRVKSKDYQVQPNSESQQSRNTTKRKLTKERVHRWFMIAIPVFSTIFAMGFLFYAVHIVSNAPSNMMGE